MTPEEEAWMIREHAPKVFVTLAAHKEQIIKMSKQEWAAIEMVGHGMGMSRQAMPHMLALYVDDRDQFLTSFSQMNHEDYSLKRDETTEETRENKKHCRLALWEILDTKLKKCIANIARNHENKIAMITDVYFHNPMLFKRMEETYLYKASMAKLWCVNKGIADMKGDKKFFNETMMLLANTGFASMGRERIFVTI